MIYGGSLDDAFTTYQIGKRRSPIYLNLELETSESSTRVSNYKLRFFGRIIFYTTDVDKLYSYLISNSSLSGLISLVNEPVDAPWGKIFSCRRTRWL